MTTQEPGDLLAVAEPKHSAAVEPSLDFLQAKADEWMADAQVAEMFDSIAAVFSEYATGPQMEKFREQLHALAHLCFVEGAYRAWTEIQDEARRELLPPATEQSGDTK